jgi:hypothetical protein
MPLSQRLPNASGEIWVQGTPHHPIWDGLPLALPVPIWWPSQFLPETIEDAFCLATYMAPGADFRVADLAFSDLLGATVLWKKWERIYGINLDPSRLSGHPAIMEVRAGKGRLILSYPHLETPGNTWANRLFLRCLEYLDETARQNLPENFPLRPFRKGESGEFDGNSLGRNPAAKLAARTLSLPGSETLKHIERAKETVDDLIDFGTRHLLWNWRLPWLLNWRRGIRGLEYGTLSVVLDHLFRHMRDICGDSNAPDDPWLESATRIEEEVVRFCRLARSLLLEEKLATQSTNLTKLGKVNATVDRLRAELFGNEMNHGGLCRELFDQLDRFVLEMLRMERLGNE